MTIFAIKQPDLSTTLNLPAFISRVRAGFPSPAEDYIDRKLDLNEYLIQHPSATFFCWTEGESMQGAGIFDGDLLIVDRSIESQHNNIVLAWVDGGLTCKRLDKKQQRLCAEHKDYPPIPIKTDSGFEIEGVVIHSIRHHLHVCTR